MEFFQRTFPGYNISIKFEDLKKSRFFEDIVTAVKSHWNEGDRRKHPPINLEEIKEPGELFEKEIITNDSLDIWKAVIISIKNKLFFLWAESYDFLKEMVQSVFSVEKIAFNT